MNALNNVPPVRQDEQNRLFNFKGRSLDGSPFLDAIKLWIIPFCFACSSLVQDGYSLYECEQGTDPGGRIWVGAAPTAAQIREHTLRNGRLHSTLMQFISQTSDLHVTLSTLFPRDGVGAIAYLRTVIEVPRVTNQIIRMESDSLYSYAYSYSLQNSHFHCVTM